MSDTGGNNSLGAVDIFNTTEFSLDDIHWKDRDEWVKFAICIETDPDVFFPETGEHGDGAVKICRGCPVRQQCLEFALDIEKTIPDIDIFGIYGGLKKPERIKINRSRGVKNSDKHYFVASVFDTIVQSPYLEYPSM